MGGQRYILRGPMVLHLGGQWSGANDLGGQSSIYHLNVWLLLPKLSKIFCDDIVSRRECLYSTLS